MITNKYKMYLIAMLLILSFIQVGCGKKENNEKSVYLTEKIISKDNKKSEIKYTYKKIPNTSEEVKKY